ncbi:hypothetical protein S4054249_08460 [Pseudoalteromonas luteoviolacea]|uniref:RNA 2'-phosphotransferase n=1 Tax=Pseudoalteromonas luteoviolacea S4054 TaxID=1129367 RepID=A0A0F6AI56_9GAMM|nr:hypothetical protein S4054249_08460 [Pseudoalteromonas luteoviolacea]AOT12785.1 hypothetical protein S40542_08460 [Pseudoalteromonas luteoviolacea]AOT17698.1 hypothetical protein S4054_08455 [Pseudoalteromonas luteoviolacea]KKE85892.1 hypothetical protein N479_00530 [Pseudoalteromonas luteoviolacea S4054]KZN74770.1 hypothetical protein N481_08910 [Pseudoalteromonas luteoviolacea S4047-1]
MIRANQGHSIDVDLALEATIPPDILFHGTASRFIQSIKEIGLVKGQRHHVHLTESTDTAMKVAVMANLSCLALTLKQCTCKVHSFIERTIMYGWLSMYRPNI